MTPLVEKVQGLLPVRLTWGRAGGLKVKTVNGGAGVRNRQRERRGNKMEMNSGETWRESEEPRLWKLPPESQPDSSLAQISSFKKGQLKACWAHAAPSLQYLGFPQEPRGGGGSGRGCLCLICTQLHTNIWGFLPDGLLFHLPSAPVDLSLRRVGC